MMINRYCILNSLISFNLTVYELREKLNSITWDSDESVTLTKIQLKKVINRFIDGEITKDELIE